MFRMPAEWMPHERCWMIWPRRQEVWGERMAATKRAYAAVAQTIARFEPVTMIASPDDLAEAERLCGKGIELLPLQVDDSWARDSAPCFVHDGQGLGAVCFEFNAWGGKYHPYDKDAAMGAALAGHLGTSMIAGGIVAEGGAISVDGQGTALTTESCLLNPNRNPGKSKAEIEAALKATLGLEKVIWLPGDVNETETDGHVDGIAVFAGPGRVIIETPADPELSYADALNANREVLRASRDALGREFEIIELGAVEGVDAQGADFSTCYVNFYIANGAIIAPSHGVPEDETARDVLAKAFPDREIVQVPVSDIAIGGGGIHCITQQQPRVSAAHS